jgi:type II secretory pathway pseudopilin PulG
MTTRSRGFTLTDILVTIFIIAALVSIALPILGRMHRSSEASRKKADLNTITVALDAFKAKHGDYPRLNQKTLRKLLAGQYNTEEQFQNLYNRFLDSKTRGSQLLTMALLDGGFVPETFRTVEVDDAMSGKVRLLATHDSRPILYYPGLPVRPDLSRRNAYVASMGPAEIENARNARQAWQLPLFNAWDNEQFLVEPIVQETLGAHTSGDYVGGSLQAMPKYSGAYLLWAAGDDADLVDAYRGEQAILLVGGGQPLVMVPGGSAVMGGPQVDYAAYANYSPHRQAPADWNSPNYQPPTALLPGDDTGKVVPPVRNGPPPGWTEHEIPPRTPNPPPADAINIIDKGAKPNDGVDDFDAIKKALEEARQRGKAIVVPDGDFDLRQPLPVNSGSKIYGPGSLRINNGHHFALEIPGGSDGIYIDGIALQGGGARVINRSSNITFINNVIANISHSGSYNIGAGLVANGGLTNSVVEQNHFINIAQEGVWINTDAANTSVSYNYFKDVWQPVHVISGGGFGSPPAPGIRINHNYGTGMIRMGIEFQGYNAIDAEIIGNTFKDWSDRLHDHEAFGLSIYNMGRGTKVQDNMLSGRSRTTVGIEFGGSVNAIASGNVVSGFREGMHVIQAANSQITGNTFTGQGWMSIWFPGYGGHGVPNTGVHVTNNSFELGGEAAILFMGGGWDGVTIDGNTAKLGANTQFVKSHSGTGGIRMGSNSVSR